MGSRLLMFLRASRGEAHAGDLTHQVVCDVSRRRAVAGYHESADLPENELDGPSMATVSD